MTDYQAMLGALEDKPSHEESLQDLVTQIVWELSPAVRKKIEQRLETSRQAFSRADAHGHETWYPVKVGACALFQQLTKGNQA